MNKEDLAVDQAMIVWRGVGTRFKCDARVAHIARKYVTLEIWHGPGRTSEMQFDIVTQKERGNTSHYAAVFLTPEAQDRQDRESAARATLKEFGVVVQFERTSDRPRLTLDQMESMVFLLERWDELGGRGDADSEVPDQGA